MDIQWNILIKQFSILGLERRSAFWPGWKSHLRIDDRLLGAALFE